MLPLLKRIEQALQGEPDNTLTIILLGIAALTILVAIKGNPVLKASLATWLLLP